MSQRDLALRAHQAILLMKAQPQPGKLKTLCKKTPSTLCQSGLAQTVVFLRSRDRPKSRETHGTQYLEQLVKVMDRGDIKTIKALQDKALKADVVDYIALSAEVQRAVEWMRRFAQIEMADIQEQEDQRDDE